MLALNGLELQNYFEEQIISFVRCLCVILTPKVSKTLHGQETSNPLAWSTTLRRLHRTLAAALFSNEIVSAESFRDTSSDFFFFFFFLGGGGGGSNRGLIRIHQSARARARANQIGSDVHHEASPHIATNRNSVTLENGCVWKSYFTLISHEENFYGLVSLLNETIHTNFHSGIEPSPVSHER